MKGLTRKRMALICAGLGTVAAVSAFSFGATNALFTSQADGQTNTITAGTITLAENGAASTAYNITDLMPGDGACYSPPTDANYVCNHPRNEYKLDYSGQAAFVGLDFSLTSTADKACSVADGAITPDALVAACSGTTGALPLFDGKSSPGDLDLSITPENGDTAHQLVVDTDLVNATSCNVSSGVASCTAEIDNIMMPVGYGGSPNSGLQWVDGSSDHVQVDLGMPLTAGNAFQGSSVSFTMQSHAVQWANNNTTKGSSSPACASGTTFPNGISAGTAPCPISWS